MDITSQNSLRGGKSSLPPGILNETFNLPDETLNWYAEEYIQFIAPWAFLVGSEMPNFHQFIVWHEQRGHGATAALSALDPEISLGEPKESTLPKIRALLREIVGISGGNQS